ncbi:hypothetical protein SAMN02927921_04027 [Sinomicrobium oceani]|uniref:Uncharacterized protein n=1 Tax=Sinomicrobium oceani TaxID=1150368 RepID=A0A1K1RUM1_9FLAO|nr:hypothetical protein SAMN02927921_04027 [Sinomicrobium oceani]
MVQNYKFSRYRENLRELFYIKKIVRYRKLSRYWEFYIISLSKPQ